MVLFSSLVPGLGSGSGRALIVNFSPYLWRLVGVVVIPLALGGCATHTAQSSTVRKESGYASPRSPEEHEGKSVSTKDRKKSRLVCSFCGKSHKAVKKLIAGPQVYICNECVALCNEILEEDDKSVKPKQVPHED